MLFLSEKWVEALSRERETGMGYQVVTIFLRDGRRYEGVIVVDGTISQVAGSTSLPFVEEDIARIAVTHDPSDRSSLS
jgi:hypothetical protein